MCEGRRQLVRLLVGKIKIHGQKGAPKTKHVARTFSRKVVGQFRMFRGFLLFLQILGLLSFKASRRPHGRIRCIKRVVDVVQSQELEKTWLQSSLHVVIWMGKCADIPSFEEMEAKVNRSTKSANSV